MRAVLARPIVRLERMTSDLQEQDTPMTTQGRRRATLQHGNGYHCPTSCGRQAVHSQTNSWGAFLVTSNSIESHSESIEPAFVLEKGCRSSGSSYGGRSNVSGWAAR